MASMITRTPAGRPADVYVRMHVCIYPCNLTACETTYG